MNSDNTKHVKAKLNIGQTGYVAVSIDHFGKHSLSCSDCAFETPGPDSSSECANTDCRGVVYMTPTKRYYLDNKILLEKLGTFGRESVVTTGRDGNYASMLAQIKSVGKTIEEFKLLEKIVEQEAEELSSKVRGGKRLAYDETND